MTKKYTAANGTVFTDEDIEKWAEEAETGSLVCSYFRSL